MLARSYDYLYVLLFSILHECGHIIALYSFKGKADKICLSFYGIGLSHSSKFSYTKDLIFLLSGILVNIFFAIVGIKRDINIALAFVNSLPIYPLDFGRALKLTLNEFLGLRISDIAYNVISVITIILLIILAIYIKSVSLLLIVAYIIIYALNNSAV